MTEPDVTPTRPDVRPAGRVRRRLAAASARLPFRSGGGVDRRVATPTVLQMEAVECGAASLAMILAYHGLFIPLEELRLTCGVSRDGSKASNLVRAARKYGLISRGYKKEPAELRGLPVPAIVHWNFNHFMVFEGFKNGKAYLNDPSSGPTVVPIAEFDEAFTGVVLLFEPGPNFVRGGEASGLLKPLGRRLSGSGAAVAFAILGGLALIVPGLVSPSFQKVFIDDVLVKGLSEWVKPLLLIMGATAAITAALNFMQQHYLLRFEGKLALGTSSKFVWHVLRLPVTFFTQRYAGDIASRVPSNDRVARLLSGELATTALNILMLALYAVLLVKYDITLTLIAIAIASLNLAALRYVSRKRVDLNQRLQSDRGRMMSTAMGGLQSIETLKAGGSESDLFSRWAGYQAKVVNATQELQLTTMVLSSVPPLLLGINGALIIGLGGLRVMDGRLTMGMLIAFQTLMQSFLGPVNKMVDLGSTLQDVKGDMARLDDVLRAKRDPVVDAPVPPDGDIVKLDGMLEMRGVSFGYSPLDPPLIENFSLTVAPGSRVALVGGSGSGKTTVAKLVAGLYQPRDGTILFDGKPREEWPRSVFTGSLAVVDQDIAMFEASIRENLTLWDATVPESDVVRAARDACIHDDLSARAGGYNAPMEEGGRNFSGGQRQRLEIARALVGNPSILVLDEATSALDPTTEKEIDDNLRRRGCTCLIVAHRLSTIRDCDEIIVMDRGRIVQRGTHTELAVVPGPYKNLIAAA
jgi:NHLM bacteriocin system ABC transporter peptidase/ATP-binding protein